ncbi:MAG: hypothetical protein JWP29_3026 [Rhodoferax sp.]|nr:hypothetical protein [Rhodoferax sp.]
MNLSEDPVGAIAAQEADDVCALPLVRRLSATLDIDPGRWKEGQAIPRGWHLALFSVDTPQSRVRGDGFAGLGINLPDLGLPRIVFGGRRIRFHGDIPIGAHLRRTTRLLSVAPKTGRSGRVAIVTIEHLVFIAGDDRPVITELQDYIMREAADPRVTVAAADKSASAGIAPGATEKPGMPEATVRQVVVPDELLLFRVSAVMFNPHRIHYDLPYTMEREAYPALVVNGSVSSLLLLEFFRRESGLEPDFIDLRNGGLAFSGRPLRLNAVEGVRSWQVWADNADGGMVIEGRMGVGRDE